MKGLLLLVAAMLSCASLSAQTTDDSNTKKIQFSDNKAQPNLIGGITLGTTGIGLEVTKPISRNWDVRAGFDFMVHFNYDMDFKVTVGDEAANKDKNISKTRFNKMASALYDVTGYHVDEKVVMEGVPKMYNARVLVDFKPFNNKRWHITAGFYYGNSTIATAENSKEDMTSLFSVGLYNKMYEKAMANEALINVGGTEYYVPSDIEKRMQQYGRMQIHVGTFKRDVYYDQDVYYQNDVYQNGEVIHHEGDLMHKAGDIKHKKGDPYDMEPDENSMVKVTAKANKFKPYLGFGYMGMLTKKDPRWQVGFDAGAMFWGGSPELRTHDGTDLIHDVDVSRKKVRRYVKLFKLAKVMPVVNFRITRTIF